MSLLTSLSDEQSAVVHYEGNALLTACPGSGKTRTVAAKIAHRIVNRKDSDRRWILAITHTRVAANEISERLDRSGVESSQLWVGTIHSFCLDWIIKPYTGEHPRLSKGYRIIDEHEQRRILREVKALAGVSGWAEVPTRVNASMEPLEKLSGSTLEAATLYHAKLSAEGLIDFDMILSIAERLVTTNIEIGARLAGVFSLILVDEYQDLSQQQYEIISSISAHRISEFLLVGDADQAIYTTLGAVVKDLSELKKQLALTEMKEFHLTWCYRSTQEIIDFYQRYQERPLRIYSRLNPPAASTSISYRQDIPFADLPAHVADLINRHLDDGISPSEIVVLSPQWPDAARLGREIQTLLPSLRIDSPNSSPLPRNFENRWHSFVRLITTAADGTNYSFRQRLARSVHTDLVSMGFAVRDVQDSIRLILVAANSISDPGNETISDYISTASAEFCKHLGLTFESSVEANEELLSYREALRDRIDYLKLDDVSRAIFPQPHARPGSRVTSYHSTKGEEFDVVIATGLLVGKLPNWHDVINKTPRHTDYVTRRLLYVASSRARSHLHLISECGCKSSTGRVLLPTPQIDWR